MLEQLPLGVVEASPTGEVLSVNVNARLLMGGSAELKDVIKRLAVGAWASETCVEHTVALGRLGELRMWASRSREKEGVIVILERNVAARSRLESKLMAALVRAATGVEGWMASASRALETMCASLPSTHFVLYELDDKRQLAPTAHAGLPQMLLGALRPLSKHPSELVGRCFVTGRMMAVSPTTSSALVLPFAYPQSGPLAAIVVPLMGSAGLRGVFYACGPDSVLQESEARLLLALAEMLGLLLEQKGRDEQIKAQRDRFSSLLENLPDAVLETRGEGTIVLAGGRTGDVFGLQPQHLQGHSWHEFVSEADQPKLEAAIRDRVPVDLHLTGADGVERVCSVAAHAAPDEVTRLVFRDMTPVNLLRAEADSAREAAHRNERLAILGRLTAGVGHELNNPLSYLTTNLRTLREELETLEDKVTTPAFTEMQAIVDDCEEGVKRLVSIVQALKGSSRQGPTESSAVFDPAHAVNNAVTLFRGVHRHQVQLDWECRSLPLVCGSVSSLSQIVLNLMQNAFDSMGGKGKIVVSGGVNADDGSVLIEVTDNGPGIPPEIQGRMFEPFFTTKAEGTGTGLGLYLCQQMVQSMRGGLKFTTGPEGTQFTVRLPLADEMDDAPTQAA